MFSKKNVLKILKKQQILQQPWIRNPSSTITPECIGEIERLWNDPAIKRVWDEDLSSVGESASYFFGQLERISSPNYIPSVEDVLRVRVKTTGVGEIAFDIADVGFRMVDVGGQRSERRKWIHCFQNVNAVIFFVAINEYNMKLIEDPSVNRMQEAIALFDEIANSRWFESSAVILFLNKQDLFQEKIKKVDMKCLFDDYDGTQTFAFFSFFFPRCFYSPLFPSHNLFFLFFFFNILIVISFSTLLCLFVQFFFTLFFFSYHLFLFLL